MKNAELLLRSIIEMAHDAIITSDSSGDIIFWNQAAVDIFGYSHDEIIGKSVIAITPQRFHEAHQKGMRRVTTTGESNIIGSTVEISGLRKDGTEIPIELTLAKWKIKDGGFLEIDQNNNYWYEEFPSYKRAHVLNGFIYSLIGLYEYYKYTKYKKAKLLFDFGIKTLEKNLHRFDINMLLFKWSRYDTGKIFYSGRKYHNKVHLPQLKNPSTGINNLKIK